MTKVLIVDDHPVILRGVRRIMEDAGVGTVHEATDIVAGYRLFHRLRPDIVVADLTFRTGALSGLSLIRQIRALARETRILAFSMHDDPVIVSRALESGATGYVLKDVPAAQFHEAFEAVRAGRSYLPHALATRVAMLGLGARRSPLADLTARELQVLSLLGRGQSYQAIADALAVSYRTVIGASAILRHKLGVRTLAELIHVAVSQDENGFGR
ncbi:response regulator transcription factor [Methylobacterium sp. BTF04]|uniref:response regulator n=1 Tax=Methylobacterium sp. BTF04 TaxID=2708300 RepID=UPI0013D5A64A|nr:response regulator transcription factor [Methylobacterium sp. BTF04]